MPPSRLTDVTDYDGAPPLEVKPAFTWPAASVVLGLLATANHLIWWLFQ